MLKHEQPRLLVELMARVAASDPAASVVLDLDGTLLDNRPRMRRILLDCAAGWGAERATIHSRLAALADDQIAYEVEDTLLAAGLNDPALVAEAVTFFRQRFFTDAYLRYDRATPGAVVFARQLYAAGARLIYLTGRDVQHMGQGTLASLRAHGFPVLEPRAMLCMKPDASVRDLDFKLRALPELERQGRLLAFIDNDPRQCDAFADLYPDPDRFTILFGSNRPPRAQPRNRSVLHLATF